MTPQTFISMQKVTKIFGTNTVLNELDLDIKKGEIVSLIGPSGSGKSTLLRCINLLEPIDEGEIWFGGVEISVPGLDPNPVRRRIGMVFQSYNLFPHKSVLENICLAPTRVLGRSSGDARERALSLLDQFGLADKAKSYPDQLSGGQQQRVAIVRALAIDPEVLLLDEITSALDPELVGEVLDAVRNLRNTGMTVVLATHEMSFAREISDTVCMLDSGVIIEKGQPSEIFSDAQNPRTRQFLSRVNTR